MNTPQESPGVVRVDAVAVAAGKDHSLVLYDDGAVLSFGKNEDGQCDVPRQLSGVKAISAGGFHSLALREDGTVAAWGGNIFRQSEGDCCTSR